MASNETSDDYQTERIVRNTRGLIQLAETTPVQCFEGAARNVLPSVNVYGVWDSGNSGFQTSTDRSIAQFSTRVNLAEIDTKIRLFTGLMPTGLRKTAEVNRIGNHRSVVPLFAGGSGNCGTDYTMEKLDPAHRMADVIRLFARYAPSNVRLYEWMSSLSYLDVCRLMRDKGMSQNYIQTFAPAFMRGVKYLDAAARISYRVDIAKGILHWGDSPLDTVTQKLETVFSGVGWGIWVLSPNGEFYTASHKTGEFHHSSFLSGEPVKAAGEWQVRNGRIAVITGKTGHYRCGTNALVLALRQLSGMDALPASAKVIVWKNDTATSVLAHAFLKDEKLQSDYTAFGNQPYHLPKRAARGWINGTRPTPNGATQIASAHRLNPLESDEHETVTRPGYDHNR